MGIKRGTFREGTRILVNQKIKSTAFQLMIGQNMRPLLKNTFFYRNQIMV